MGSGHSVVVTGASSGIGRAVAMQLALGGWTVVCVSRREPALRAVVQAIRDAGLDACAVAADVTREDCVRDVLARAERAGSLRGLVHAAGVLGAISPLVDVPVREWVDVVTTNLVGSMIVLKYAARRMTAHGAPASIVLLSGGGASTAFPNYSAYAASKTAVVRLAETAAAELRGTRVRVNALAPGFVATPIHAATLDAGPDRAGPAYYEATMRRLDADDGAPMARAVAAIELLLSERAGDLTGRFLSAEHDDLEALVARSPAFSEDAYRLRRQAGHSTPISSQSANR
jgi:NAD(P)-dependent dehydrogenase (short-subunit alcohol dehydrogenase family)